MDWADTASTFVPYFGSSRVDDLNGTTSFVNWSVTANATNTTTYGPHYRPGKAYTYCDLEEAWYDGIACKLAEEAKLRPNDKKLLPDGSKIIIDDKGNYRIEDENSKVTYRANRIRDFSPHLNASDMVAQFVDYVRTLGVKRDEVMGLPIELFINWLVINAAERDDDPVPDEVIPVGQHQVVLEMKRPRCLFCQRYISIKNYDKRFKFCNLEHGNKYLARIQSQKTARITHVEDGDSDGC